MPHPTPPPFRPNPALAAQLREAGGGASAEAEAEAAAWDRLLEDERAVGRRCGTCAVCCEVLGVIELDKAPGSACRFVLSDTGAGGACGIHAQRPGGCRAYACAWKLGLYDDGARPDRIGALLEWHELEPEFHPFAGHWLLRTVGADATEAAQAIIEHQAGLGCLVLHHRGANRPMDLHYPDGSVDDEAGNAPSWEAEQRGEPLGFRVAYYDSYREALPRALRRRIESGQLPFLA